MPGNERTAVEAEIRAAGGQVGAVNALAAFDRFIIAYRLPAGADPGELGTRIARASAGARLDANTVYRLEGAQARRYAGALTGWPDISRCAGTAIPVGVLDGPLPGDVLQALPNDVRVWPSPAAGSAGDAVEEASAAAVHAAGIIGILAGDGAGATGILPPSTPLRLAAVFKDDGARTRADAVGIAQGLDWLAGEEVRVINLSFAGPQNEILSALLEAAAQRGIVLVAAAGNAGATDDPETSYPAWIGATIAVTAIDARMVRAPMANRGSFIEFAAPGVDIYSGWAGGGRYLSGTSYAAPFVTALAALQLAAAPHLSADVVRLLIRENVIDLGPKGRDSDFGWGLIQADRLCASVPPLP